MVRVVLGATALSEEERVADWELNRGRACRTKRSEGEHGFCDVSFLERVGERAKRNAGN